MVTQTTEKRSASRFQLPALDLKFGSLTEGTNIPAPIPSPVLEEPGQPTHPSMNQEAMDAINGKAPAVPPKSPTNGVKREADDTPGSPTASHRGSLRRLLSRNFLNQAHDDQASVAGTTNGHNNSRPPSRTASIVADDKRAKRSSWFQRLRSSNNPGSNNKRNSTQIPPSRPEPAAPPPPMIPELSDLKTKVDTNIGDDLFKGIK